MINDVYLFTKEVFFEQEAALTIALLEHFDFTLHLRKPGATIEEYERYLQSLPKVFHPNIVIHNHWKLIERYQLKGVHFATRHRAAAVAYQHCYTSTSCHSIDELKEMDGQFSQLFISPVFNSISKKNYMANIHPEGIKKYLHTKPKSSIIALGGIQGSNIHLIEKMGFGAAALLGAVWTNAENSTTEDFITNYHQLIQCINTAPIA